MNNKALKANIADFYEKLSMDAQFNKFARINPAAALAACDIDITKHKVTFMVKIDDIDVHHFVIPSNRDMLNDEEMNAINAAKKDYKPVGVFGCE